MKNLKQLTALSTFLLLMNSAYAYKYIIYTDDTKTDKAEQIADIMTKTYPFSKFDIDIEIVTLKPHELDCSSKYGIDRLITCDISGELQARAAVTGGDQAMILKDSETYGGSSHVGGGVPVITTATSPRAMLHEYLHTLGLCDEYEYKESEAEIYCNDRRAPPVNVVFIEPWDPYVSDGQARSRHMSQIPWATDILSTTPITNSGGTQLGTGDVSDSKRAIVNDTTNPVMLAEPTGLYKGKVCNNALRRKVSWHPGGSVTVMENFNAGLGAPLEKVVERLLISKGVKKKLQFEDVPVVKEQSPSSVVVTPQPEIAVDNSPRALIKSVFEWGKSWGMNMFENVKKVLSR